MVNHHTFPNQIPLHFSDFFKTCGKFTELPSEFALN